MNLRIIKLSVIALLSSILVFLAPLTYAAGLDYDSIYDPNGKLIEMSNGVNFVYDANGNLIKRKNTIRDTDLSFTASKGFAERQGYNQWYYQEWDGSKYIDMTWNNESKYWGGKGIWSRVYNNTQHPDGNDSVRKWVAPKKGTIKISGKVAKLEGQILGDGVRVKIVKNSTQIWPQNGWQTIAADDIKGINVDITTKVETNDSIYFLVNQNNTISYDSTSWDPRITYQSNVNNATREFSSIQGENNWFYQEWDGNKYIDMKWNEDLKFWSGKALWSRVYNNIQHPDGTDSIRKWRAPKNGEVRISGSVAKLEGQIYGDGVKVKILKNSTQIWPETGWVTIDANKSNGYDISINTKVNQGDALYFVVNQNVTINYDGTVWDQNIEYLPARHEASKEYSSLQGKNNWYYQEWDGASYVDMKWNEDLNCWNGRALWSRVLNTIQHPDGQDSVRKWLAPSSNMIRISGKVAKLEGQINGDGVRVKIMKNSSQIWPITGWQFIQANDTKGYDIELIEEVNQGDAIYFVVNQNGTIGYDGTYWDPVITLFPKD